MKGLATLLLCSSLIGVTLAGKVPSRDRRSVLQFHEMLACASGRAATDFSDYGCYCGLGGFGDPVDSLDRCCQRHDNCYSGLISRGFCPEGTNVYHASYHFTKTDCVTQWSFLSKRDYQLVCESQYNDDCQARMCECDRRAAMCMSAMDYDNSYANYDKNDKC